MRKTRRCHHTAVTLQAGGRLVARRCDRPRGHDGPCYDSHGTWTPPATTGPDPAPQVRQQPLTSVAARA